MTTTSQVLDFYRRQSGMSDPGAHAARLAALPEDLPELATGLQGLILHEHWSGAYGQVLGDERRGEVHLRDVPAMIDRMLAHDARPLSEARPLDTRLIGNCRDYTLFTVAALRARDVPARSRCGFGAYFDPRQKVDHWVAEYWDDARGRWIMADAQIDAFQAERIHPDFDLLDVPPDRFIVAGAAWRACRAGQADPNTFGIMDMTGWWFLAGNLVRDAAALAGREMLPWDCWGAMPGPGDAIGEARLAWFDRLAELTADPDANLDTLIALNRDDERQAVPPVVFNAVRQRPETV